MTSLTRYPSITWSKVKTEFVSLLSAEIFKTKVTTYLSKVKGIQKLYLYLVQRTFQLSDNKAHCFQLSAWPLVMIWAIKVIVKWFQIANCIQLLREGQSMKLISVLSWNGNCNFIYTVHRLSSSDSKTHCIIWAIKVPIKWFQIANCTQLLWGGTFNESDDSYLF